MMPISPIGISTRNLSAFTLRQSPEQAGFTLVELLVVIVILSLATALSLPLLADRGAGAERQKMRRIAGTVKQIYNEATLTRDQFLLTFDIGRNSVEAFRLRSNGTVVEKEEFGRKLNISPLKLRQIDVKGQGSFRTGRVSVRIYPLGWMDATEVSFEREGGSQVQLVFSPLTGTTTINEERSRLQ